MVDIKQNVRIRKNKVDIKGLQKLFKEHKTISNNEIAERAKTKINDIPDNKDLRSKIKVRKPGRKPKNKYRVFANVYLQGGKNGGQYGVPLELGHRLVYFGNKTYRHVAAKPFLRPAADESKDAVRDILARGMNEILEEMGGMK